MVFVRSVSCAACGEENPAGNRFCGSCGALLERRCPACKYANPPGHHFCGGCGASLEAIAPPPRPAAAKHLADKIRQARSALEGERKQVTVLFADVQGSMELAERLDSRIMERFFTILADGVALDGKPLVVPYPTLPRDGGSSDFALTFQLVRPQETRPAALDADAVERLRALGYVE